MAGGKGGRPRKPTTKLKLHNTYRKDRRFADEPELDIAIPDCPSILKDAAKREWYRITVELCKQKLLSQVDMATLAGYCHAWGEVVKIDRSIQRQKKTYGGIYLTEGSSGNMVLHPLIRARESAWKLVLKFGTEFGLSPVSRTRISTSKVENKNPFVEFMDVS